MFKWDIYGIEQTEKCLNKTKCINILRKSGQYYDKASVSK